MLCWQSFSQFHKLTESIRRAVWKRWGGSAGLFGKNDVERVDEPRDEAEQCKHDVDQQRYVAAGLAEDGQWLRERCV